jgi:hemolysin activation/secretion protein
MSLSYRQKIRQYWLGPIIVFGLISSSLVQAQVSADEELRRRSQREAEERKAQQQTPDIFLQRGTEEKEKIDLPEEQPCFVIQTIELNGARHSAFNWIISYLQPYTAKCIGKNGINLILKRVTNELIARGYVTTRINIPEQDISKGTLKLQLVAGVIRQIKFADNDPRGSWKTAFPARAGDILNLRDLEQGLEQMTRLPSQEIDMQMTPGDIPGESDVVINRKKTKPWRGVVALDDSGSKATGKYQSSVNLAIDDLLGINDIVNLSLNANAKDSDGRGTRGDNASYSVPYGYWTFSMAASKYHYHQTIAGATQTFVSSGNSESIEARVQRLIDRGQRHKTLLQLRVNKKRSSSFIDDTEVLVQRRITTAAELALQHRQYIGQMTVDLNAAYRKGVPWFNAQDDNSLPDAPTTRYEIWTFDGNLTAPFSIRDLKLRYRGNLRMQTTDNLLFAQEFFAIGNRYTVRGFDGEQTLAAERGWLIRNDIGLPFAGGNHEFYIGIDHGEVSGPSADLLIGKQLIGSALGVRGNIKKFNYDVSIGWALRKPTGFSTQQPAYAFQLSYQF